MIPFKLSWVSDEFIGGYLRKHGWRGQVHLWESHFSMSDNSPKRHGWSPAQLNQKSLLGPSSCLCCLLWGPVRSLLTLSWLSHPPPLHQRMFQPRVNYTMVDLKALKPEGSLGLSTHDPHHHRYRGCGVSRHACAGR